MFFPLGTEVLANSHICPACIYESVKTIGCSGHAEQASYCACARLPVSSSQVVRMLGIIPPHAAAGVTTGKDPSVVCKSGDCA